MSKKLSLKEKSTRNKELPGVRLEKVVAKIQQMMDQNSIVTHNETLIDRVGNKRQYDIVIRGQFGGRPVLGVMECKDHNRKKGPDAVEAFAKKTENLGANLRVMVSKKGFTKQALNLAKHENIGCLSLVPKDSDQVGFRIGTFWYGEVRRWDSLRLIVHFALPSSPISTFESDKVCWKGKPVINWFKKVLITQYGNETLEGEHALELKFDEQRNIEIEGKEYPVSGITCIGTRIYRKKKKWVSWSGDAFYDWHTNQISIPAKGELIGSAVESNISLWPDYSGEIPKNGEASTQGGVWLVFYDIQKWDANNDKEIPNLDIL